MARYIPFADVAEYVVKTISVEQLRETFEQAICDVERGEEYLITRDGQPVAWLMRYEIGFGPLDSEALRRCGWPEGTQ